jgi:hypothetical protein
MAGDDGDVEMGRGSGPYPVLPPGTDLQYLAEGAANVVYRLGTTRQALPSDQVQSEKAKETMKDDGRGDQFRGRDPPFIT